MANMTNLKARGLYTFQNFLSSIPEGALLDATNVVIDRDGIIEPRRGITRYGEIGATPSNRVKQLLTYKDRILAHYSDKLAYDDGTGTMTDFTGTFPEVEAGLRVKGVEFNGNFYITTNTGIKKISSSTSNLASATISAAGGVKALDLQAVIDYSTAGFFTGFSKVAYRIVWGTKDVNSNLILGSPSNRVVVTNYDPSTTGIVELTFTVPDGITTNYFYQVYRTAVITADPATFEILQEIDPGEEMRLVYESPVTQAEIDAKQVVTTDITPEDFQQGGVYLYTNPTTGDGILQANEPPPAAKDIAIFKNTLFLANTRTKHTLDLNLLGTGELESGVITSVVNSSGLLTLTSNDHGLVNGQTVAVVIPNSSILTSTANIDVDADTIGASVHGLTDGQVIQITSTGTMPDGLTSGVDYYVVNATMDDFQVSTTFNGTPVDITTTGTGNLNIGPFTVQNVYIVENATTNTFDVSTAGQTQVADVDGAKWFSSYITITGSGSSNDYYFVGNAEETDITFDTQANTADGSWFEISAADNTVQYAIWFNKTGTTIAPLVPGKLLIEVDISSGVTTAAEVAEAVQLAVEDATADFNIAISTATLTFFTANNGLCDPAVAGTVAPGGAFAIDIIQRGYGENYLKRFVRWSGYLSAGQSVDDTAQSLVKVINKNANEVIYAYYISGVDDVPGLMNFQRRSIEDAEFTVVANNTSVGSLFNPEIKTFVTSSDEESPNRLYFSKYQQPEAVPIVNNLDIGPKDKAILRIVPLRDSLFIFKEDGIYRLTGENSTNFSVVLFDNSVELIAPDSPGVLNNQIYALTDGGIATVTETGVGIISRPIENIFKSVTTDNYPAFRESSFGVGYETERSYYIWTVTDTTDTYATQCFRYNTFTQSWTRWDKPQTAAVINKRDTRMYLGSAVLNEVEVERKSLTRRDYADGEYDLTMGNDALSDKTITLSSVANLNTGDAIVQTQYVTISQFNNLLTKLDMDPRIGMPTGTFDTDYHATLEMVPGDNLTNKMANLVTKLNADAGTDHGYTFNGASDFATIQSEFNNIITALNADTKLKFTNYQQSSGTYDREITVVSVDRNDATVEADFTPKFMVGPMTGYKGIRTSVIWAPVSGGDPSMLKHFRETTTMFEDTGFRGGVMSYNSDLSASFESTRFVMDGNGGWGSFNWGENTFGGGGSSVPMRTYIPRQKQRCRFIRAKFQHNDAFYKFAILGISFVFEVSSERAYRGKN